MTIVHHYIEEPPRRKKSLQIDHQFQKSLAIPNLKISIYIHRKIILIVFFCIPYFIEINLAFQWNRLQDIGKFDDQSLQKMSFPCEFVQLIRFIFLLYGPPVFSPFGDVLEFLFSSTF